VDSSKKLGMGIEPDLRIVAKDMLSHVASLTADIPTYLHTALHVGF
jgi:hypothetical protein